MSNHTPARLQFDALDVIRALQGFGNEEAVTVIPNVMMKKIEEEIERLLAVEDNAYELILQMSGDLLKNGNKQIRSLVDLFGIVVEEEETAEPPELTPLKPMR